MKKWISIILFVAVIAVTAKSQNSVAYAYDANGNRVQRYFVGLRPVRNPDISSASDSTRTLKDIQKTGLNVYPNPTADKITVSINRPEKPDEWRGANLHLTDLTGRNLLHKKCTNVETDLDMRSVPPGQYILKVELNKKEEVSYNVIKVN